MKRKIIIDTDPGQDDALAILLALRPEELDVLYCYCGWKRTTTVDNSQCQGTC